MDIILINAQGKVSTVVMPLGLSIMVNSLRMNGFEPTLIDLIPVDAEKRIEHLKSSISDKPAIYAFSVVIGSHLLIEVEKYAKIILEKNPENLIVYGGPLASSSTKLLLKNCLCTHIVTGEGEIAFPAWIKSVHEGESYPENIPGLYCRKNGEIVGTRKQMIGDLGPLSKPDYTLFDMEYYISYLKEMGQSFQIMATRGCSKTCTFCYRLMGTRFTARAIDSVLDDIAEIIDKYNMRKFYFLDDDFLGYEGYFDEFIKQKKERDLDFEFILQVRLDHVTEEICRVGKENGLICFSTGTESIFQHTLDKINKDLSIEEVREKIKLIDRMGITLSTNFIIGFEWETESDYEYMIEFIKETKLNKRANLSYLTPLPNTIFFKQSKNRGLIKDEFEYIKNMDDFGWEFYLNMTSMPDEVLQSWYQKIYSLLQRDVVLPKSEKYLKNISEKYFDRIPMDKWTSKEDLASRNVHRQLDPLGVLLPPESRKF